MTFLERLIWPCAATTPSWDEKPSRKASNASTVLSEMELHRDETSSTCSYSSSCSVDSPRLSDEYLNSPQIPRFERKRCWNCGRIYLTDASSAPGDTPYLAANLIEKHVDDDSFCSLDCQSNHDYLQSIEKMIRKYQEQQQLAYSVSEESVPPSYAETISLSSY